MALNKEFFKDIWHKIQKYVGDNKNWFFLISFLILIAIRIYYFVLTSSQPVWWDEADYLGIAKTWVGIMDYPVNAIRPVLLPMVISIIYLFGLGEFWVRIFILLTSIGGLYFMYRLGKLFFNRIVGTIAMIFLGGFWVFNFYSSRILVDIPLIFLWLGAIFFFFYGYLKNKSWIYFALAGFFVGLSFLMKFTSFALVFLFAIYILCTEKLNFIKNKKIWIFALVSFLVVVPFFLWEFFKFGSLIAFYEISSAGIITKISFLPSFFGHLMLSLRWAGLVVMIVFFLSLAWILFNFFLTLKYSFRKNSDSNKFFFLFVWLILGIGVFAWLFSPVSAEDRYYLIFYPVIFLICAKGLGDFYSYAKKFSKVLPIILIALLLGIFLFTSLSQADQIINLKKTSFLELKQAGLWINEHTMENESFLVTEESAETVYYAERPYNIENHNLANKTDLLNRIELHAPSYIVLSFYYYLNRNEGGSLEVIEYVFSNPDKFKVVQTYGPNMIPDGNLPLVVIVEVLD